MWQTGGNLNATNGGSQSNSAQMQSRKQGGSLGNRKTSLEQKFNQSNFGRQFDISQQNLVGYKGIGSNLGGEPTGVALTQKLQGGPPMLNEHQSMPIMSTSVQAQRFLANTQGAMSGQLQSGTPSDMQIPSFIQRQAQQQQTMGVGGTNQQKKAQAYLANS